MGEERLESKQRNTETNSEDLRATFSFVMFLGTFMIVSWVAVYYLFISR